MTQRNFCRLLGILAIFAWSFVILYFYGSGKINNYIRPEYLRDFSLIAGLGLGVMGVFNILNLKKPDPLEHAHHDHDHDHGCGSSCGHDHGHEGEGEHDHEDTTIFGNSAMLLVMVVPVLMAASFSKDQFVSMQTITNKGFEDDPNAVASRMNEDFLPSKQREKAMKEDAIAKERAKATPGVETSMETMADGSANPVPEESTKPADEWEYTLEDLEKVVDRSEEGNLMLSVDQLFYTTGDEELQHVLDGQPVETIGQVIPEDGYDPDGNRLRLFTLMVTCCAADAQPISLPVQFPEGTPEYKEMAWVKVSGTMIYPMENGRKQAVLKVNKMEPTEEPVDYFMF